MKFKITKGTFPENGYGDEVIPLSSHAVLSEVMPNQAIIIYKCGECKMQIVKEFTFCPFCGEKLNWA